MRHMQVRVFTATVSDSRTAQTDSSGDMLKAELGKAGFKMVRHVIIKDEVNLIQDLVRSVSLENAADAMVLTGGTGIAPRDVTPEALDAIFDKRIPGFGEAFRQRSWDQPMSSAYRTAKPDAPAVLGARAMLSRASAGVVDGLVVFSLPGSTRAVALGVSLIAPVLEHACELAIGSRVSHA